MKKITRYIKERHEWVIVIGGFIGLMNIVCWVLMLMCHSGDVKGAIHIQSINVTIMKFYAVVLFLLFREDIWNWLTTTIPNYIKQEYNIYKEMEDE